LNILMIMSTPFPPEEGIGYHVYNLTNELIKRGDKVTILTRGGFIESRGEVDGIDYIKLPFFPLYPFHVIIHGLFVNKFLNNNSKKYDLVHIHSPLSPVPNTSIPIVSTIHSSIVGDSRNNEILDLKGIVSGFLSVTTSKKLINKLLLKSKITITVSNTVCGELKQYYGYHNAIVIGNGINVNEFKINHGEVGIPSIPTLIYVGRLSEGKGIFDLLDGIKLIQQTRPVKLLICGKGRLRKKIEKYISINQLENSVVMMGQVSHGQLIDLFGKSSIFISPSYHEGLPTAVMEAMAAGVPVLLSNIQAHKELIEENYSGFLFLKGDSEDFRKKLLYVLENQKSWNIIRKNAREIVEYNYSWAAIVNRIANTYMEAIKR